MAKAPSNPGFKQREKTSIPRTTLVDGSTFRLISATDSFTALKMVQHRCPKFPSMRYSSPGLPYTSTVVSHRPIIDDLRTLKIGFWPSDLSPRYPSHRWCKLGLCFPPQITDQNQMRLGCLNKWDDHVRDFQQINAKNSDLTWRQPLWWTNSNLINLFFSVSQAKDFNSLSRLVWNIRSHWVDSVWDTAKNI